MQLLSICSINIAVYVLHPNKPIMPDTVSDFVNANTLVDKIDKWVAPEVTTPTQTKTEEAVTETKTESVLSDVVVVDSTEDVNIGMATIATWDLVDDWKPLSEYAYDSAAEELKKKAEEEAMNFIKWDQLPDIEIKSIEKEKAIEEITQWLEEIIEKKGEQSPEEVLEAISTDFYIRLEKEKTQNVLLKSANEDLEKMIKELQTENLKLKHWSTKIDVTDDYMWAFAVTYNDLKKTEDEKEKNNLSKKMAAIHLGWLKMIYPELDSQDVLDLIAKKREQGLKAIQWLTEGWQRDVKIQEKSREIRRPSPFVPM